MVLNALILWMCRDLTHLCHVAGETVTLEWQTAVVVLVVKNKKKKKKN